MNNRLILLLFFMLGLSLTQAVQAKKKVEVSTKPYLGYRQDQIKWTTGGSNNPAANGNTQKWKNLRGLEYGINTEITFIDRYKIDLDFGFANLFNGTMTDINYLAGPGSGNPATNTIKGSAFVFQPNLAFGFNMKPLKCLDLLPKIGISYDLIKLSGNKSSTSALTSLSNTLNFYGPYIGVDSKLKLTKRLALDFGGAFKIAFYNGSGNWKFTNDTNSNTMSQSGWGYGLRGQVGLQYLVVKTVALGAEAAVEWNRIKNGNDSRSFTNGTSLKPKLKSADWTTLSGRITLTKSF